MAFWKLFWNKTKVIQINQYSDNYNKIKHKILVQDFDYKNKKINIFLSKDKNINLYELEELCDTVGWVRRPLKKVKIAIEHSFLTISLFYQSNNHKKLIAFARATSDNTFNATIWDVVVHPDFQGRGLGRILIKEAIKQLRYADINTITLFADPQVISFYKNLGFISDPDGIKGMFWYPH
uniref:GCN5-like N-acetyltransferase n=1 Tax=Synarthrophyton patena TaxID=48972 RepID=UPI002181FF0E|nr:GCN5-like N-acetyltransferase [Synarthrophyton patena]UVF62842.1 GCN5-like N-acetyltransferase [Synarthrophyton patena]